MRPSFSLALSIFVTTATIGCSDEHATRAVIVALTDSLPEPGSGGGLVRVNGVAVGRAIASGAGDGMANLIVAIGDIAGVIDGPAGSGQSHLLLRGQWLFAIRTGGCAACALRVRRAVLLSTRVSRRADGGYVPLTDLVSALEGWVENTAGAGDILIRVGDCRWCSLEPGSR